MTHPTFAGVPLLCNVFKVRCFNCPTKHTWPQGKRNVLGHLDFSKHLERLGWKLGSNQKFICPDCDLELNRQDDTVD